jgi:putative phosphotransacetylase
MMRFPNDAMLPVEVSARHIHLSQEHQDILFGPGYKMTIKKQLSQTGQWAAEERVTVRGPKGELKCTVLGPCRPQTQVEFAWSDGFATGIEVPVRESGHLEGTPGCTVVGPKGTIELAKGVINPQRHLHIRDTEAAAWGLEKNDVISFHVDGGQPVTFHQAVVRVHPTFRMNIHLDTDEGNACSAPMKGMKAKLVKIARAGKVIYVDPSSCDLL